MSQRDRRGAVVPVGRPIGPRNLAGRFRNGGCPSLHIVAKLPRGQAEGRPVAMAVQLNLMSCSHQLRCQTARSVYLLAYEEERCVHPRDVELLEDRRSAPQVRSVVESQSDVTPAVDVVAEA